MSRIQGLLLLAITAVLGSATASSAAGDLDRTVLPIAEPKRPLYRELDARNAKAPRPST